MKFDTETRSALEAREAAQWLAFAPFIFQAARCLRSLGVLDALDRHREGATAALIESETQLSTYAVRVLLEAGMGLGLVLEQHAQYRLSKTGWFWLHDAMTKANADFSHDVNYLGLFHLEDALKSGKPEGLKVFGEWPTVYRALAELPAQVQKSWFGFDHHYSDAAFAAALPKLFAYSPRRVLDIGGNTGKFARKLLAYSPNVTVGIADLPGQLAMAQKGLAAEGLAHRVEFVECDLLNPKTALPGGWDVIWMSQFLDCFAEAEIISILQRARAALAPQGRIAILEPFWDRQRFASATMSLQMTSLYFTAMANGNSQMYRSTLFLKLLEAAGLRTDAEFDDLGTGHTLLLATAA